MKQFEFTTIHALSILVILLIAIFLIQPSIFGTMINTFLGRLTLLFILILITSHHTMCGLVSVLLIISIYEYYNRFEGMSDSMPSSSPPSPPVPVKDPVQPNESGATSSPASIPVNEPVQPTTSSVDSMDTSKKTELESQIQKGKNSKQLPNATTNSTANVVASENTKTSSEGFANLFGNEWSSF
jgi:cytoskeletal protein RodZ